MAVGLPRWGSCTLWVKPELRKPPFWFRLVRLRQHQCIERYALGLGSESQLGVDGLWHAGDKLAGGAERSYIAGAE